jgi:16S rRNA C967 or C1407 C5-methylase (RsmB/RsmF family)
MASRKVAKRKREIHTAARGVLAFDSQGPQLLSKKEIKEKKVAENRIWKSVSRHGWSNQEANPRHAAYYKQQLQLGSAEYAELSGAMAKPQSVTIRLDESRNPYVARAIRQRLLTEFQFRGSFVAVDGAVLKNVAHQMSWYPNGHGDAWQINTDAQGLSRTAVLKPLHEMLCREVELGHLVRQEAASMLPALLLGVKPAHRVLDMCAAPGSKTEQLLSLLSKKGPGDGPVPQGMVVANDCDPKRIGTMSKRYSRARHPSLLITCSHGQTLCSAINRPYFDRVLVDVPCTGDGTFRKFPHLWRLWRTRRALELHPIQLELAISAAALTKVGQRMVYSTCSLNPIENEAVVAALLLHARGNLQLVHPQPILPKLKYRQGIYSWGGDVDSMVSGHAPLRAVISPDLYNY